jgi:hypothetical protein
MTLKPGGQGPWSSRCRGKGYDSKAAGVSIPFWNGTAGKNLCSFPKGVQAPEVARPTVGSPVGGLTRHDGSPAVSKPSEGKAMDFETRLD